MGQAQLVRWDGFADGIRIKVWTYDERAEFIAAGTLWLEPSIIRMMGEEIAAEQQDAKQYEFDFDE